MNARRVVDRDGHAWPVTGARCPLCRMPADPVLDGEPHPMCLPARRVSPAEYAAALRMLAEGLGPIVEHRPLDRWRVSGAALPTPPSTPAADPILAAIAVAGSDAELTEVWRSNRGAWTDDHTAAVRRRLTQIGDA